MQGFYSNLLVIHRGGCGTIDTVYDSQNETIYRTSEIQFQLITDDLKQMNIINSLIGFTCMSISQQMQNHKRQPLVFLVVFPSFSACIKIKPTFRLFPLFKKHYINVCMYFRDQLKRAQNKDLADGFSEQKDFTGMTTKIDIKYSDTKPFMQGIKVRQQLLIEPKVREIIENFCKKNGWDYDAWQQKVANNPFFSF